jgi:hypothetical protein
MLHLRRPSRQVLPPVFQFLRLYRPFRSSVSQRNKTSAWGTMRDSRQRARAPCFPVTEYRRRARQRTTHNPARPAATRQIPRCTKHWPRPVHRVLDLRQPLSRPQRWPIPRCRRQFKGHHRVRCREHFKEPYRGQSKERFKQQPDSPRPTPPPINRTAAVRHPQTRSRVCRRQESRPSPPAPARYKWRKWSAKRRNRRCGSG